jgi:hypothetical protein
VKRIAIGAVIVCVFSLAPAAQAAYDPLGGGTTELTLDRAFARLLSENGVALVAKQGARQKGRVFTLPVSGGQVDPTTGKGSVDNEGVLVFQGARGKVPLRELAVKTTHQPLIAKVGGGQLKVASAAKTGSVRTGFGSTFEARKLKLSAKVATRLNKKLRPEAPFAAGQPLGALVAKTQPQLVTILDQGRATLLFDPAFAAKLDSRFVSLNPIFPAEHVGPTFTFPIIAGGAIAPDASQGTLRSGGEVELLQLGAGQVFWREPWLDLEARTDTAEVDVEPTPTFPGKLGRVGVFDLGAAVVSSDPKARTIAVSGMPLSLQSDAAARLNEAFGQGQAVFVAGEAMGSVSFVAVGQ